MSESVVVFVGTYTEPTYRGKGAGIYSYKLNLKTGSLEPLAKPVGVVNPSYIAIDPSKRHLYCVNELQGYEGAVSGSATAFAIAPNTQALKKLNAQATCGTDPCHIAIDREGRHALVSNYSSGSVCVFPIAPDGNLGKSSQMIEHAGSSVNPDRQAGPHVHSVSFDPEEGHALVCDLGLDKLVAYKYDGEAQRPLSRVEGLGLSMKPGSGPRHCAFHPSGKYLYLINELDSTIVAVRYQPEGSGCAILQTVPVTSETPAATDLSAAIRVSPNGKFLYASNRGRDSIIVYRIDETTGHLSFVSSESSGGRSPRDFIIDPTGALLVAANQGSDSLAVFRIDPVSGTLAKISAIEIPTPVCVMAYLPNEPGL